MRFLIPCIFLLLSVISFGQETSTKLRGAHFSYFPADLFIGVHAGSLKNRHEQLFIVETGMLRTFFQQRLYPQLAYQYSYHLMEHNFVRGGVGARPVINMLHVNRAAKNGYVFSEGAYATGFLEFGEKNRFRATGGFGPSMEQKYASMSGKFINTFTWEYFGELSWTHVF